MTVSFRQVQGTMTVGTRQPQRHDYLLSLAATCNNPNLLFLCDETWQCSRANPKHCEAKNK